MTDKPRLIEVVLYFDQEVFDAIDGDALGLLSFRSQLAEIAERVPSEFLGDAVIKFQRGNRESIVDFSVSYRRLETRQEATARREVESANVVADQLKEKLLYLRLRAKYEPTAEDLKWRIGND